MYQQLIRPLLFCLDAETAHELTLFVLQYLPKLCFSKPASSPVQVMGLKFPHPVGLAAGLDKNGAYVDALAKLGFAFIEVGTVTPRPQLGNVKPRLFRLPAAQALINRMGFNNQGVDVLVANIKKANYQGILGINIGKNKDTPLNEAVNDYLYCLRKVYLQASYVTINISSPNTPDLRQLQHREYFNDLISQLRKEQLQLMDHHQRYVPLVIKLSPDESDEALKEMADVIVSHGIDGIIATNTTCARNDVKHLLHGNEEGGLSGRPLAARSTQCLQLLKQRVGNEVAFIGVGGIDCPAAAKDKLAAGASLLQVYTGLIYQGPAFVKALVEGIESS
ncbi:quinone-dependent dihydroorotate dehydrogenase [Legionella oakridgensis]|uniref:Dihydroorotate dehydrogenase (quinone) n=2 Tax=Legionella oakridgensis TaxID=29423 RepID=W0BGF0_9GAMM|nr:quinone-dependent dihydroorotate dehydrogenase [Legionella oakridgensis]AHE67751.1 dihydroorotate dehydrogenase, subfamily 2 [Legionella oakridgensis ATCC 33761 = DSM 21215]ETO92712.1 dihydroorotate oxidase A [Legionella oakridgensis RV-2-2007]KTD36921.1 dihydroorotate oxidase [Legionella oakridgensis]STY20770.1 dihydroorotate oxidase [Legionella longbeachae]